MFDAARLRAVYQRVRDDLLAEQEGGHWVGELSSSALATATAVSALAIVERQSAELRHARVVDEQGPHSFRELIDGGVRALATSQNADGGWGDTDKSLSNIATTMLVRAAVHLAGVASSHGEQLTRAAQYIEAHDGIEGLRRRYGRDKTFAVPILTNCALAGLAPWSEVAPLPFEAACVPQRLYRFLQLPVVSYAIPALVAIGQARYFHRRPRNPFAYIARRLAVAPSLAVLERIQPASGGFLEAVPLTSFVVMSLASIGRVGHPVVRRGVEFLLASARADGTWPIDTNLATWNTTLAINSLAAAGEDLAHLQCIPWLLSCQWNQRHPYTGAAPGGFAWTDLSGGVPDVDDTSGALLALAAWRERAGADEDDDRSGGDGDHGAQLQVAAASAVRWLLDLQNRDGGWPTFCRGWGRLPFDRSGADLTAHALRALSAWENHLPAEQLRIRQARRRGFDYLSRTQREDGSWVPLWFGNQYHPAEENPVYGTARVLLAYADCGLVNDEPSRRAVQWLVDCQNGDGGWTGAGPFAVSDRATPAESTVEETALALESLLATSVANELQDVIVRGLTWLAAAVEEGRHHVASPIGFYFARLWYYERLYPQVYTAAALGRAQARIPSPSTHAPADAQPAPAPLHRPTR